MDLGDYGNGKSSHSFVGIAMCKPAGNGTTIILYLRARNPTPAFLCRRFNL